MIDKVNKKLMFVIPSLQGGGAEKVASIILKEFSSSGIDVVLVLFSKEYIYEISEQVKVKYLDIKPNKNFIYVIYKFFYIIFKLSRIIKKEKPYRILSFLDYTNIVVILSSFLSLHMTKVIISVRTSPTLYLYEYSKTFWNNVITVFVKLFYNKADMIITVSEYSKKDLIENYGIEREKIVIIYNPVDINRIYALSEEEVSHTWFNDNIPVIISVGRLSKEKGIEYLLRAIAIVKETISARLLIVGDGEEKNYLKDISSKLGIDRDVYFAGFKKNPYKFMKRSTVFVLPSLCEGFPNALIEAMTCGVPVISTIYNPSTSEIIKNEKDGLLVPVKDEKAIADAILRLLNDEELRVTLSKGAREKVENFYVGKIMDRYKSVLDI